MTFDTIRRDLMRARLAYEQLGTRPPKVFARYSSGMSSDLPIHLRRSGFVGAMLIAWKRAPIRKVRKPRSRGKRATGTFIAALAPKVIDAADASNF